MESEQPPKIDNFRKIPGTKLFRSSKPSTPSCIPLLKQQNLRTVFDVTSSDDVDNIKKAIDDVYHPFKLQTPFTGMGDRPQLVSLSEPEVNPEELLERDRRYRISVPMCSIRRLVGSSPWYIRLLIIVCAIIDGVLGTKLASKALVTAVINPLGSDGLLWIMKIILMEHGAELSSILHMLCLPEYVPAVIMCSLGKDRTGLLSALIGHICGQNREEILKEFQQSEKELPTNNKVIMKMDAMGVHPSTKLAPAECLIALFDIVDQKYGSMDGYLESIGFGQEEQEKLRRNIMSKY